MTMLPGTPTWTDHEKEQLTILWGDGLSARQIGSQLGRSKGAVCGMARRLKLSSRQVFKGESKAKVARRSRLARPKVYQPKSGDRKSLKGAAWESLPDTSPVTLLDLETGMCKWPIGEAKPYLFCGAQAEGSYCEHHQSLSMRARS